MDIQISPTKKITKDRLNYIYCEKRGGRWQAIWFYPTLACCYQDLLEELTKQGDKDSLKENVGEAVNMLEGLKKQIEKLSQNRV